MNVDLTEKVALVTGAGGAIGRSIAIQMARAGAKIVATDIHMQNAQETINEVMALGGEGLSIFCDVSDRGSVIKAIEQTIENYGKLDILINNAGINGGPDDRHPINSYSDDLWHKIISVDLDGVYYCSKYAAQAMIKQGTGGNIINISSVVGLVPLRLQCAFAAAKAGVVNLSKAMALELAPQEIRVNVIAPGSILFEGTKTLFYQDAEKAEALLSHIPQHRPGETDDVANAVCFLASDLSKYITGSVVTVDGGWTSGYMRNF